MTQRSFTIIAMVFSLSSGFCSDGRGQSPFETQSQRESAWLSETWTANNTLWRRLRLSTENDVAKTTNRGQLLQRLRAMAQAQPKDAQAQYHWAYAIFCSTVEGSAPAERLVPVAARALAAVPSPHAYEFARARFLLESKLFPSPRMRGVGERLAQRDPNDYSVKYRLVKILDPGLSVQEKQLTLLYARDLVRLQPNRASAHAALASVYFRAWLLSKNASDKRNSLSAYNRYLQLAPKSDPFRPQAQRLIAMMNTKR